MKAIGDAAEKKAARFLKKKGYKIIETNYTVHHVGEIDIIAKDGETLVFVEVKFRKNDLSGRPEEFVGREKRRRLQRTAMQYMTVHDIHLPVRFDVVGIMGEKKEEQIELIQNAFFAEF